MPAFGFCLARQSARAVAFAQVNRADALSGYSISWSFGMAEVCFAARRSDTESRMPSALSAGLCEPVVTTIEGEASRGEGARRFVVSPVSVFAGTKPSCGRDACSADGWRPALTSNWSLS